MLNQGQLKATPSERTAAWYGSFCEAIREHDRRKALGQIDRAQIAVRKRLQELRNSSQENANEAQDLENAATYLSILVLHIASESGKLLWD
jgi:hypothetical protein